MSDDRDLIHAARRGDRDALGELLIRHQARLRATAARYLSQRDDIQDMVQDAFVEAFQHLERFDAEADFGPWIREILRHRIFNLLRSRARARAHLARVDDALIACDAEPADGRSLAALRECLAQLPERQQKLLSDRYADRIAVAELAHRDGKSAGSVTMMLRRLRDALGRCIADRTREVLP